MVNLVLPRVVAGVLAAVVLAASSALAAPPAGCPKGRVVKVKPKEHKKKVGKAASVEQLKALLAPLDLVSGWSDGLSCAPESRPAVTLDVFRARIMSGEKEDFVLQARGSVCERSILAGVLLHPMKEADTFCALQLPFLPGGLGAGGGTVTFGFENLTDPVRQVFKVESTWSDPRSSGREMAYWEAQDGELRSIFSITLSSESIGWIGGSDSAKVTVLVTGYPQEILIEESTTSCGEFVEMPSGERVYSSDCTTTENRVRMCYQRDSKGVAQYRPCLGPY